MVKLSQPENPVIGTHVVSIKQWQSQLHYYVHQQVNTVEITNITGKVAVKHCLTMDSLTIVDTFTTSQTPDFFGWWCPYPTPPAKTCNLH